MNKTVKAHVDCATGALGLGWLSTWFLSGTLEDLLALGLAAAVAYVSVVNLPLKRREAKDRLHELCSDFVQVRIPRTGCKDLCLEAGVSAASNVPIECMPRMSCLPASTRLRSMLRITLQHILPLKEGYALIKFIW